jgi:hypothetical protein
MREGGGEEVVSCAHKGGGMGPRLCRRGRVLGMLLGWLKWVHPKMRGLVNLGRAPSCLLDWSGRAPKWEVWWVWSAPQVAYLIKVGAPQSERFDDFFLLLESKQLRIARFCLLTVIQPHDLILLKKRVDWEGSNWVCRRELKETGERWNLKIWKWGIWEGKGWGSRGIKLYLEYQSVCYLIGNGKSWIVHYPTLLFFGFLLKNTNVCFFSLLKIQNHYRTFMLHFVFLKF